MPVPPVSAPHADYARSILIWITSTDIIGDVDSTMPASTRRWAQTRRRVALASAPLDQGKRSLHRRGCGRARDRSCRGLPRRRGLGRGSLVVWVSSTCPTRPETGRAASRPLAGGSPEEVLGPSPLRQTVDGPWLIGQIGRARWPSSQFFGVIQPSSRGTRPTSGRSSRIRPRAVRHNTVADTPEDSAGERSGGRDVDELVREDAHPSYSGSVE